MFNLAQFCTQTKDILRFVGYILTLVKVAIPLLIIAFGIFDLGKAVIASDDKEVKAAQGRLIKRFIYAALIFFVTTLVSVLMDLVSKGGNDAGDTTSWQSCWRSASN